MGCTLEAVLTRSRNDRILKPYCVLVLGDGSAATASNPIERVGHACTAGELITYMFPPSALQDKNGTISFDEFVQLMRISYI